jgi:hypothetical protein
MQRIEFSRYDVPIHCPFCGQKVLDSSSAETSPCIHTLYIAHDIGFEYRSEKINELLEMPSVIDGDHSLEWEDLDRELPENGYDGLTDAIELKESFKLATYVPAPGFMGTYVGFWIPPGWVP